MTDPRFYINEFGHKCWKPEHEPEWIKARRRAFEEQQERQRSYDSDWHNGAGCYDNDYDLDQS